MKTSHSPRPTPTYPYQYSADTVDSFLESYARAAGFFADICHIERRKLRGILIKLFQFNNVRWNVVRDIIKWIEKSNHYAKLRAMTYENCMAYLTAVKYQAEDQIIFCKNQLSSIDSPQD